MGAALFLPALFFLKGDGTKADELVELKGRYKALSYESKRKTCDLEFLVMDERPTLKAARGASEGRLRP